ncbi:hypothetical protein CBR_g3171 [Chara braunii]|uniref:GrpE protein homolog n=1 Tax=Chara braunii TaxID=69332 RepID=A0A388KF05_CHABU|nr:hypothetical protein CBR_g3171 [Chara braunii]|eukprot:GBG68630.1 hypothetical protein CBR_g3171 [Chara braunii]
MAGGRTWAVLDKTLRRAAAGPIGQLQLPRGGSSFARLPRPLSSRGGDGSQELLKSFFPGGSLVETEHYGAPLCRLLATFSRANLPQGDTCHRAYKHHHHHHHPRRPIIPVGGVLSSHGDRASSSPSSSLSSSPFLPSSPPSPSLIHQDAGCGMGGGSAAATIRQPAAHGRRLLSAQALRIAVAGGAQLHSVCAGARRNVSSSPYSSSASVGSDETAAADQAGKEGESRQGGAAGEATAAAAAGTKPTAETGNIELKKEELIALLMDQEKVVAEKDDMIGSLKDTVLRSYADMENLRERTRREVDSVRRFAVQDFAKALLDVADNFERAMSVIPRDFLKGGDGGEASSLPPESDPTKLLRDFAVGVEMTEKQLGKVLKKYGVEKFDPIGEEFNPNEHQAMFEVDQFEGVEKEGKVAMVTKVGYKILDRVLRPAEVGVYKKSASS